MSVIQLERRALLRELFEQFGVPLDKLAKAGRMGVAGLTALAEAEDWAHSGSVQELLQRTILECRHHVLALRDADGDEGRQEKQARALSVLAKTLETLVQVERRLQNDETSNGADENNRANQKATMDAHSSVQLYDEIERVLAGMANQRNVEKTVTTSQGGDI